VLVEASGWETLQSCFPEADGGETCEVPISAPDGSSRLVQWRLSEVEGAQGDETVIVCSGTDITDRKRLEQQLLQAEKLSALGQLIAGVAHELNNPLTGVIGFAEIANNQPDCPERIREDLQQITTNAKRCKAVVDNLLRFARQHKPERRSFAIVDVIESTLELMSYHFRTAGIEVLRQLGDRSLRVNGDCNEIQQVFVNLLGNAIQAIKETGARGTISVRTSIHEGRVRCVIADTGPGIPPDKLGTIFDPFYTTKPVGEGTGLGLGVCFGIVASHRGRIWAESDGERGATFVVELPLDEGRKRVERPKTTESQMLRLRQRVLVVDDEEAVRSVLERVLTSFGFRVTTVASAEEARDLFQKDSFDIVLCDLRMPGLGGPGLYDWVSARDPQLVKRMVFCTGDTVSQEAREFIRRTKCRVVSKPFNVSRLAQTLSEIQYEIVNEKTVR
jgi:two-component system NtrC family sensor kinase